MFWILGSVFSLRDTEGIKLKKVPGYECFCYKIFASLLFIRPTYERPIFHFGYRRTAEGLACSRRSDSGERCEEKRTAKK